jgi:hypothetical protein
MDSAVERLTKLVDSPERFDLPLATLLPLQLEAANERLQSRMHSMRLLSSRVETSGAREIKAPEDLVPLLFAHSVYKSYPEAWLNQAKWAQMGQWLDTVSSRRVQGIDVAGVTNIDEWLERLARGGHYVSCSSGTTGKVSLINASMADRTFNKRVVTTTLQWATGLTADNTRKVFRCNPSSNNFRNIDTGAAVAEAFGRGGVYEFPGGTITVGAVRRMVELRRSIAEGTARPTDIAAFEATAAEREQRLEDIVVEIAKAMAAQRHEKLLVIGMYGLLFRVVEAVRSLGYEAKDFHPENALVVGGGTKGATLPADYHERILAALNIDASRVYKFYSMQELNSHFPRCRAGRYHTPPWVMLLLLDTPGEKVLASAAGEMEGRAAFFDLSHDGRWGGIISGDRIHVRYGKCECGHEGPTVGAEIVRYADLEGGDNISCAGTVDAYVRGLA